jgi:hypothetical protein
VQGGFAQSPAQVVLVRRRAGDAGEGAQEVVWAEAGAFGEVREREGGVGVAFGQLMTVRWILGA